jgi:hypothetical protein
MPGPQAKVICGKGLISGFTRQTRSAAQRNPVIEAPDVLAGVLLPARTQLGRSHSGTGRKVFGSPALITPLRSKKGHRPDARKR